MYQRTERTLWVGAIMLVIAAVIMSRRHTITQASTAQTRVPHTAVMMFDPDQFSTTAERTMARDPFRVERKPSDVSFGTPDPAPAPLAPPARPFQSLVLKGIIGGPPWQAIFAGIPNRGDNAVAHVGDTLAGLRVIRIRRDGAVLRGRDTLLTLPLTRTWQ